MICYGMLGGGDALRGNGREVGAAVSEKTAVRAALKFHIREYFNCRPFFACPIHLLS